MERARIRASTAPTDELMSEKGSRRRSAGARPQPRAADRPPRPFRPPTFG